MMGEIVFVGLVFGLALLATAAIVTGPIAIVSCVIFPDVPEIRIASIAAMGMPALCMLAVILMVVTPLGVDDNGPQVSGGIFIALGLIIVLILGFPIGRAFAIWLFRHFK